MPSRKLLLLASVILFISFIYFSYLVSKETFVQFDFDTTVKVQDHLPRKVDLPFSLLSLIGSAEVTGLIWVAMLIFSLIKRYWLTLLTLPLFWAAMAFEVFGKLFVYHPGPSFLLYRGVIKFNFPSSYAHTEYSYPSGHLTRTSFLTFFLIMFFALQIKGKMKFPVQLVLLSFWLAMFISRVYLGEHWTTDVIGGALLGSSMGIFTALTIPQTENIA